MPSSDEPRVPNLFICLASRTGQLIRPTPGQAIRQNARVISSAGDYRTAKIARYCLLAGLAASAVKCAAGQLIRIEDTRLLTNAVSPQRPQAERALRRPRRVAGPDVRPPRWLEGPGPGASSPGQQARDLPGQAPGPPAAVTLPKDLSLTERVVRITLCRHQRLVAASRSAVRPITEQSPSGRYAITCNVITSQWITKVSPRLSA